MRISFKSKKKLFRGRRAVHAASKSAFKAQNSEEHQQRRFKAIKANKMIAVDMAQKTGSRWAATWNLAEVVDCADQQLPATRYVEEGTHHECRETRAILRQMLTSWRLQDHGVDIPRLVSHRTALRRVDITMQVQSTNKNTRLGSRASTRYHVM
jgi:hypothetical protein